MVIQLLLYGQTNRQGGSALPVGLLYQRFYHALIILCVKHVTCVRSVMQVLGIDGHELTVIPNTCCYIFVIFQK
jgi:hypothetical protein